MAGIQGDVQVAERLPAAQRRQLAGPPPVAARRFGGRQAAGAEGDAHGRLQRIAGGHDQRLGGDFKRRRQALFGCIEVVPQGFKFLAGQRPGERLQGIPVRRPPQRAQPGQTPVRDGGRLRLQQAGAGRQGEAEQAAAAAWENQIHAAS